MDRSEDFNKNNNGSVFPISLKGSPLLHLNVYVPKILYFVLLV